MKKKREQADYLVCANCGKSRENTRENLEKGCPECGYRGVYLAFTLPPLAGKSITFTIEEDAERLIKQITKVY